MTTRWGKDALPDSSIRALVVDGHDAARIGLGVLLRREPWIASCRLARDRDTALAHLRREPADVAVLDISDAAAFAGASVSMLQSARPSLEVVLTSRSPVAGPLPPGAAALLSPASDGAATLAAVRAAVLGERQAAAPADAVTLHLSVREREILALLATGATNREIAAALHLGPDSVKKYATGVYRKLGVRNRTQAAQRAAELLVAA